MKNAFADSQEISSPKRARFMSHFQQERNGGAYIARTQSPMENQGSSPLGLKLRKSPSLLDLIQLSISQRNRENSEDVNRLTTEESHRIQNTRFAAAKPSALDKKKATNFSASVLRIGEWEYASRYEGDLVAKCYFSKRKLVWEVLERGLKSKVEIQWQDITGLKAIYPQNQPATLEIELSRPPMFFRESNPQPRKHTIWQATSDFTGGQATIYKRHLLQFPNGQLERHYQSLIQSDPRLNMLSRKGLATTDSPLFDFRFTPFRDQQSLYFQLLQGGNLSDAYLNSDSYLPPLTSLPEREQTSIPNLEHMEPGERFSGSSVSTGGDAAAWPSKKMILDDLAHYLLGDSLVTSDHHDESIIDRVHSNVHPLRPHDFHELQKRIGSFDY